MQFKLLTILLIFVSAASAADKQLHETLFKAASRGNSYHYSTGIDNEVTFNQVRSAFIKSHSKNLELNKYAALMLNSDTSQVKGKRLRFSAFIKAENVQGWAGLWLRIDGRPHIFKKVRNWLTLAFDNMQNRPITGTMDWTQYSIVLDVPDNAENMAFGVLLVGSGKVWLNDFQFEAVSSDVPVTDQLIDSNNSN